MYQHKSGAQKRKDRSVREKNEKENAKKEKTLFKFNFETKISNCNDDAPGSSHENVVLPTPIPAQEKQISEEEIPAQEKQIPEEEMKKGK